MSGQAGGASGKAPHGEQLLSNGDCPGDPGDHCRYRAHYRNRSGSGSGSLPLRSFLGVGPCCFLAVPYWRTQLSR